MSDPLLGAWAPPLLRPTTGKRGPPPAAATAHEVSTHTATLPSPFPFQAARPAARSPAARRVPCASALPPHLIATLADAAAKPGSVDAPVWAIAVGAVVVTAGALLLASGLKPGER